MFSSWSGAHWYCAVSVSLGVDSGPQGRLLSPPPQPGVLHADSCSAALIKAACAQDVVIPSSAFDAMVRPFPSPILELADDFLLTEQPTPGADKSSPIPRNQSLVRTPSRGILCLWTQQRGHSIPPAGAGSLRLAL